MGLFERLRIKAYIRFHQRQHPNAMGSAEVMGFLDHLASDQHES
ncbi:phage integrase N-terminal SAM-like domain-containing protein [Oceanobacter antarcticus]|uniref:Integrase SAM-like N-terminal domain-containing protein n=1 Tax=Oceanobacter antarcticus TaxID=3133425 RepID=A0ABW8NKH8_9GAMM